MILNVMSVYDSVAQYFGSPFVVKSVGEAERSFIDACADDRTAFFSHPEDYRLMRIGNFNDSDGLIESCTPVLVRTGVKPVKEV